METDASMLSLVFSMHDRIKASLDGEEVGGEVTAAPAPDGLAAPVSLEELLIVAFRLGEVRRSYAPAAFLSNEEILSELSYLLDKVSGD